MEFNVAVKGCKRVVVRVEVDGEPTFESMPVLVPEGYKIGMDVRIDRDERLAFCPQPSGVQYGAG